MPEVKVTKENGGALARSEVYFPTLPFTGLFGTSPFKFMKRFTDEMDRAFAGLSTVGRVRVVGSAAGSETQGREFRRHG